VEWKNNDRDIKERRRKKQMAERTPLALKIKEKMMINVDDDG